MDAILTERLHAMPMRLPECEHARAGIGLSRKGADGALTVRLMSSDTSESWLRMPQTLLEASHISCCLRGGGTGTSQRLNVRNESAATISLTVRLTAQRLTLAPSARAP